MNEFISNKTTSILFPPRNAFMDIRTSYKPDEYVKLLGQGLDVDWAKTSPGRKLYFKAKDVRNISVPKMFYERGVRHVRVRVAQHVNPKYSGETQNPDTGRSLMQEIKEIVNDCLEANLIPVLAYQAATFKDKPFEDSSIDEVVNFWDICAQILHGTDYRLSFNFVIETTGEIKNDNGRLNDLYQAISDKIRPYDAKRIFICAANKISDPERLQFLQLPFDNKQLNIVNEYCMAEAHWYAAGPRPDGKKKWTTGTPEEKAPLQAKVDAVVKWQKETGHKTWIGAIMAADYPKVSTETLEFGAPKPTHLQPEEQESFISHNIKLLSEHGIPSAWNSDTKFFNRTENHWYRDMRRPLNLILGLPH